MKRDWPERSPTNLPASFAWTSRYSPGGRFGMVKRELGVMRPEADRRHAVRLERDRRGRRPGYAGREARPDQARTGPRTRGRDLPPACPGSGCAPRRSQPRRTRCHRAGSAAGRASSWIRPPTPVRSMRPGVHRWRGAPMPSCARSCHDHRRRRQPPTRLPTRRCRASSTRGCERGRLTTICTMAMSSTAIVNVAFGERHVDEQSVDLDADREALRRQRQRDRLPAVHLDRIETPRVREPGGVGEHHQATQPERVEHGVGAVACGRARRPSRSRRRARGRRTRSPGRATSARRATPSARARRAWHRRGSCHPGGRRSRPRRRPTSCSSVARPVRGTARRTGVITTSITTTPSIQRCSSNFGTRSRTRSTSATTISGYQASQNTSETVAVACGSPRRLQMVSPIAHSTIADGDEQPRAPVALADRSAADAAEDRGDPLGAAAQPGVEERAHARRRRDRGSR